MQIAPMNPWIHMYFATTGSQRARRAHQPQPADHAPGGAQALHARQRLVRARGGPARDASRRASSPTSWCSTGTTSRCPNEDLKRIRSVLTVVGGDIVHDAKACCAVETRAGSTTKTESCARGRGRSPAAPQRAGGGCLSTGIRSAPSAAAPSSRWRRSNGATGSGRRRRASRPGWRPRISISRPGAFRGFRSPKQEWRRRRALSERRIARRLRPLAARRAARRRRKSLPRSLVVSAPDGVDAGLAAARPWRAAARAGVALLVGDPDRRGDLSSLPDTRHWSSAARGWATGSRCCARAAWMRSRCDLGAARARGRNAYHRRARRPWTEIRRESSVEGGAPSRRA